MKMVRRIELFFGSLDKNRNGQLALLGFVILLAVGLRFYKLGAWSFWGDEYITVRRALDIWSGGLLTLSPSNVFTHLALNGFGVSEWSGRLAATVIGVLTIPVFYWLVRRQYGAQTALIAVLLLTIAPWHVYWSQNARFYTSLLLFYTLALFFFHFALEEDRPLFMFASLLFLGLASWERLVAAFLIPTIFAYIVLLKVGRFELPPGLRLKNLAIYFIPGFVALAGLILLNPSVRDISSGIRSFGFTNANPFWILSGVVFYLGVPLLIMAIFGLLGLLQRRDRSGLLLGLAALIPLLTVMGASMFVYAANRYVFIALTSVVALAAVAIRDLLAQAPRSSRWFAVGAALVLLAMPLADNMLYYQFQNGNRDNWKDAFALVSSQYQEGDQVITASRALADYYLGMDTIGMQSIEVMGLDSVIHDAPRTWIVVDITAEGKGPTTQTWARRNARLVDSFDVHISARTFPMEVYLYDPVDAATRATAVGERP